MGAWSDVQNVIDNSNRDIKVLAGDTELGKKECQSMNIPEQSLLGSVVCNTQGILVDNWIRILGQQGRGIKGIGHYNSLGSTDEFFAGLFVVALDIVGGIFAIDISRFEPGKNDMYYFAPDTLEWECMDVPYSTFLSWVFAGKVDEFYDSMRWSSWKEDCGKAAFDEGILLYPFLWAAECDVETARKKNVPLEEMISMQIEFVSKH